MSTAAEEIAAATSEIVDPMTGEVVSAVDADGLCEALARIQGEQARLRVAELAMRHALGALAASETRTAKIVGRRFEARIERPGTIWDNSALRRLWDEYPEARRYLRIERVAPAMREVAQLRKSNGPGVEPFRDALLAAEKPGSGAPTVKIVTLDKVDTSAIAAELEGLEW